MPAVPSYSPNPAHPSHAPFLSHARGQQLLNLLWISLPHDKKGLADMRDTEMVRALARTLYCSLDTCEYRNPFEHDPASSVTTLLSQPPEVFVEWLNKLTPDLLAKLPLYQHLGAVWVATVNARLPLCNKNFDDTPDTSLAMAALAKFIR